MCDARYACYINFDRPVEAWLAELHDQEMVSVHPWDVTHLRPSVLAAWGEMRDLRSFELDPISERVYHNYMCVWLCNSGTVRCAT